MELKRQFPDGPSAKLDQEANNYKRNAQSLEQKPAEVFRMIDETSQIKVSSGVRLGKYRLQVRRRMCWSLRWVSRLAGARRRRPIRTPAG